jgi:hypothetical protein
MSHGNEVRDLPTMLLNGMRVAPDRREGQEAKWDRDR